MLFIECAKGQVSLTIELLTYAVEYKMVSTSAVYACSIECKVGR
jgi:hypothetical protein